MNRNVRYQEKMPVGRIRRWICLLLSMALLCTPLYAQAINDGTSGESSVPEAYSSSKNPFGDANDDNKVDYMDAMLVLRHAVKLTTLPEDVQSRCDVDGSGNVDYMDAMMILRYAVKLIDKFPNAEPELVEQRISLKDAEPFSDGYAWVRFEDSASGSDDEYLGILGTDGKVTIVADWDEWGTFGSSFYGGYAYITSSYLADSKPDYFAIYNTSGEQIGRSPDDGNGYRVLAGGDGVYLVVQETRSMTENEDRYGFINEKGEWILEPKSFNPLWSGHSDSDISRKEIKYYYVGDHMFVAAVGSYSKYFTYYNARTNETGSWSVDHPSSIEDANGEIVTFHNGLLLLIGNYDYYSQYETKHLYSVDKSGNIVAEVAIEKPENEYNNFISAYYNDGYYFVINQLGTGAVYDLNGSKVIDFAKYSLIRNYAKGFYEFKNGIAALKIKGADGRTYIGFVDLDGNFTCDPIKLQSSINMKHHGHFGEEGLYVDVYAGEESGNKILLTDGTLNKLSNSMYNDALLEKSEFINGYTWYEPSMTQYGGFFISLKGTRLYTFVMIPK